MENQISNVLEFSQSNQQDSNLSQTGVLAASFPKPRKSGTRQTSIHNTSHHLREVDGTTRTFRHWQLSHRRISRLSSTIFILTVLVSLCCPLTTASPLVHDYPERISDPRELMKDEQRSAALNPSEPLLIDTRPPPAAAAAWAFAHNSYSGPVLEGPEDPYLDDSSYLKKRQDFLGNGDPTTSSTSSKTTAQPSTTSSPSAKATTSPSSTKTTNNSKLASSTSAGGALSTASSSDGNTPLPTVFDTSIGNNYTSESCPNFINAFLSDPQFKACLPFSLLLQNSNSFFQAEKSIVRITQVLDATCAAQSTACTIHLSNLAAALISPQNCADDYKAQNPTVLQARAGLIAYQALYSASCLKNPKTNAYCFAEAITNSSSPTDSYVYYLPLNMSLPASAQPTCDSCLKNTMDVFNAAAANRSTPIAATYGSAAAQVNVQCGPNFVAASIPASNGAAIVGAFGNASFAWTAMLMLVLAWLL